MITAKEVLEMVKYHVKHDTIDTIWTDIRANAYLGNDEGSVLVKNSFLKTAKAQLKEAGFETETPYKAHQGYTLILWKAYV